MGGGDLDAWIASIRKCELLPEHDLKHLCEYVQELMLEESTVRARAREAAAGTARRRGALTLPPPAAHARHRCTRCRAR